MLKDTVKHHYKETAGDIEMYRSRYHVLDSFIEIKIYSNIMLQGAA